MKTSYVLLRNGYADLRACLSSRRVAPIIWVCYTGNWFDYRAWDDLLYAGYGSSAA